MSNGRLQMADSSESNQYLIPIYGINLLTEILQYAMLLLIYLTSGARLHYNLK